MSAFAAMVYILGDICAGAAAKLCAGRTLVLALAASTHQVTCAWNTGGTAALLGVHDTLASGDINVITVDAL